MIKTVKPIDPSKPELVVFDIPRDTATNKRHFPLPRFTIKNVALTVFAGGLATELWRSGNLRILGFSLGLKYLSGKVVQQCHDHKISILYRFVPSAFVHISQGYNQLWNFIHSVNRLLLAPFCISDEDAKFIYTTLTSYMEEFVCRAFIQESLVKGLQAQILKTTFPDSVELENTLPHQTTRVALSAIIYGILHFHMGSLYSIWVESKKRISPQDKQEFERRFEPYIHQHHLELKPIANTVCGIGYATAMVATESLVVTASLRVLNNILVTMIDSLGVQLNPEKPKTQFPDSNKGDVAVTSARLKTRIKSKKG